MGVNEMTRFGFGKEEFARLAHLIAACVRGEEIREEVVRFRSGYTEMRYCFSDRELEGALDRICTASGPVRNAGFIGFIKRIPMGRGWFFAKRLRRNSNCTIIPAGAYRRDTSLQGHKRHRRNCNIYGGIYHEFSERTEVYQRRRMGQDD